MQGPAARLLCGAAVPSSAVIRGSMVYESVLSGAALAFLWVRSGIIHHFSIYGQMAQCTSIDMVMGVKCICYVLIPPGLTCGNMA
jgi:hypothetical protein